jgi:hypothetical protein
MRFVLAAVLAWGLAAHAQTAPSAPVDYAAIGPQVGQTVPAFSLPDQNGVLRTLASIGGPNGAMIVFFRSADW